MKTNSLVRFIVVCFALFLAVCGGDNGGGYECVSGGSGTIKEDPYVVCTAVELKELADRLNNGTEESSGKFYKLGANIDLSKTGTNWKPIGNYRDPSFKGTFDGNGKTISGLSINRSASDLYLDYLGLFGKIDGGTVTKLKLDVTILGSYSYYLGGVVGSLSNGSVSECVVNGHVIGRDNVGGVAGRVENSSISNCSATNLVRGDYYVGGVVGRAENSSISNSYATGGVSGNYRVGGVVGSLGGSISNSYATGDVSGSGDRIGGVAGRAENSSITYSYATGSVRGYNFVGGVVGNLIGSSSVEGCAALNPSISRYLSTITTSFGRVAGDVEPGGVLTNNVAYSGMTVLGVTVSDSDGNGTGITYGTGAGQINNLGTYSGAPPFVGATGGLGWLFGNNDANPWVWNNTLPVLYWQK